jgi:NADH-quinone oxidoreductase subunit E
MGDTLFASKDKKLCTVAPCYSLLCQGLNFHGFTFLIMGYRRQALYSFSRLMLMETGANMIDADKEKLDNIIKKYDGKEGFLIQLLLDLQSELHWISKETIRELSLRLKIPASQIFRVASFYKAMDLSPVGRHKVCVCMGTACQVRGAQRLLDTTESKLGIKSGQTTPDNSFTLNRVNCLGCCAIGPVIVVDDDYHGRVDSKKVERILGLLASDS